MGLLSFLFFEGRWSEEDECADFALAVVLTVKALLGGAPLLHTGAPVGAAFEPASLDLSAGCPPGCPDMSEWIAMREHAARGLVHKLEALGAAVHWHDSSEIGVELWFAVPLGALPLRALLRSLRRWHPRAFDGCRHAAQHGPQMRLLWEHLGDSGAPDWSSLTLLATQFTAASRGIPGALAVAAARSGVAAFQRLFPFLAAFEYCPVQPWGARRSHLGQGDLLFTNGLGLFATVEAKCLEGSSASPAIKRAQVAMQARRYAGTVLRSCPEAALVLPFTAEETSRGLQLSPVGAPSGSTLCSADGYDVLQQCADCFATSACPFGERVVQLV